MFVAEWVTRDVLTVGPDERIWDAARVMSQHRIRQLPVAVENQGLVGLMDPEDSPTAGQAGNKVGQHG